jgi:hypothetical protein
MLKLQQVHYKYTTPMHIGVKLTCVGPIQCTLELCTCIACITTDNKSKKKKKNQLSPQAHLRFNQQSQT